MDIYKMQPRILSRRHEVSDGAGVPVHLAARDKPFQVSNVALPIGLSVGGIVLIALGILFFLHRRNVKRQRVEDANDPHRDLDFGLGDAVPPGGKKKGRRSILMGGEKSHKNNQLSMDMNLSSPYLLPPSGAKDSHDSVHTLTRGYPSEFDPYRVVNSEAGSIRSFGRDGSVYGGSSKRASVITGRSVSTMKNPPRQGSFPRTPMTPVSAQPPSALNEKLETLGAPLAPQSALPARPAADIQQPVVPIKPVIPEIGTVPYPEDVQPADAARMPDVQQPPAALAKNPMDRVNSPPNDHALSELPDAQSVNIGMAYPGDDSSYPPGNRHQEPAGLGLNLDLPKPMSPVGVSMYPDDRDSVPAPASHAVSTPDNRRSKESYYEDEQPQISTSQYYDDYEDVGRGRSTQRQASLEMYTETQQPQQGLGVPQQNNKRLSVGFRPLPPDEALESEDPEYRANRIRSFYKEYFEDPTQAAPPMPQMAAHHSGGAQYYEDYDERYLGESAAYFDPETNAFVMPYAQPVHRRAMTPPPAGRRGPSGPGPRGPPRGGPRGPPRPHGPHGSLGGMSSPGGPRSRSRAGSAWGSRAPSSLGPRPDSSASARMGRPTQRRNLPPPAALSTLPTPSKLKDDSFALMNATDFAPPESFGERARGRSQSPLGERRAYQPKVPSASPLVNSYEELNALPSPHLLRKSSTFTGLDFLPPKKFKDSDTMSDAGSIRSNRSGMSASAASAIRAGAGRVSRLPGDQVFTQHAMASELKPQWGMRP